MMLLDSEDITGDEFIRLLADLVNSDTTPTPERIRKLERIAEHVAVTLDLAQHLINSAPSRPHRETAHQILAERLGLDMESGTEIRHREMLEHYVEEMLWGPKAREFIEAAHGGDVEQPKDEMIASMEATKRRFSINGKLGALRKTLNAARRAARERQNEEFLLVNAPILGGDFDE